MSFWIAWEAIGKEIDGAAKTAAFLFFVAWTFFALTFYFSNWWERHRWRVVSVTVLAGIGLSFLWWAYLPTPPRAEAASESNVKPLPTPSAGPSPSPTPAASPTPQPSPTTAPPAAPPEPFLVSQTAPSPAIIPVHFNRVIPLKGGSAQKLSDVLREGGYKGPTLLQELTILNPDTSAETIYLGESDVNETNGNALAPGASYTERVGLQRDLIDATQIYLFTKSAGRVSIFLRASK